MNTNNISIFTKSLLITFALAAAWEFAGLMAIGGAGYSSSRGFLGAAFLVYLLALGMLVLSEYRKKKLSLARALFFTLLAPLFLVLLVILLRSGQRRPLP